MLAVHGKPIEGLICIEDVLPVWKTSIQSSVYRTPPVGLLCMDELRSVFFVRKTFGGSFMYGRLSFFYRRTTESLPCIEDLQRLSCL